jgi:2-hydroxy-4-carboxymuconate semialdehyde hemiacetal dehydrogenase
MFGGYEFGKREGREPNASVAQVLPCYEVLDQLEQQLK